MTGREVLPKVEIPIALPLIISGVRTATRGHRRPRRSRRTSRSAASAGMSSTGWPCDFPQMFTGALLVALLVIVLDADLRSARPAHRVRRPDRSRAVRTGSTWYLLNLMNHHTRKARWLTNMEASC